MLIYEENTKFWKEYGEKDAAATDDIELAKGLYQERIRALERYIAKLEARQSKNFLNEMDKINKEN
jgi:hypothetical protein